MYKNLYLNIEKKMLKNQGYSNQTEKRLIGWRWGSNNSFKNKNTSNIKLDLLQKASPFSRVQINKSIIWSLF